MKTVSSFWAAVRWQALGNAAAQAIGILGMPMLTRLYTPEDFAAQSVFLQLAMFFAGVMTWRFEYFVQLPKEDSGALALVRLTLLLGLFSTLLLTPLVWLAAPHVPGIASQADLLDWLWLSPLTAALISVSLAYQHLVQRNGMFRLSGVGEIAAKAGYVGAGALAALGGAGALGLMLTTSAGTSCKLALHRIFGAPWTGVPTTAADMRHAVRSYGHLASSMLTSHLLGTVTGMAPVLYIGASYGSGLLGQYSLVAATIFLPAGLIGSAIGQVYYQRAAALWTQGESFAPLWRQTFVKLATIGAPAYLAIAALSPWAYPFVFGAGWDAAGRIAVPMAVAAFFSFISAPMDRSSLIVGRWRYLICWHLARTVSTLAVLFAAQHWQLGFEDFLLALAAQMSALYLIDLLAEARFARIKP